MATNYKGLTIYEPATGEGGQILNSNFKELADRSGPVQSSSVNPSTSDKDPNFYTWSKWLDTSNNKIFICVSSSTTSAHWVQVNNFSLDSSPVLGGNCNAAGFGLLNCASLTNSGGLSITATNNMDLTATSLNIGNNNLTNFKGVIFSSGTKNLTADSLSFVGTTTLGPITFPNSDTASGYFLVTNGAGNLSWSGVLPVGIIMPWPTSVAPTGWLLCDGSNFSRTIYARLFNVIGTTYGVGDGSTTFGLPNFKGKIPFGSDTSDANFNNLNVPSSYVGAVRVTLSIPNLPSHTHGVPSVAGVATMSGMYSGAGAGAPTFNTAFTGGDQAHNNMPPFVVMNYIIKF